MWHKYVNLFKTAKMFIQHNTFLLGINKTVQQDFLLNWGNIFERDMKLGWLR